MLKRLDAKWTSTSFPTIVVIFKWIILHTEVDDNDSSRFLLMYYRIFNITGCAAAPVLFNGDWACQRERANFYPLPNRHPSNERQNIHRRSLCRIWRTWCKSVHRGFCENGWNITKFYLFIYRFFSETLGQVRPLHKFSCVMTQTTRNQTRVCFLGSRWCCSKFMGQIHQNPYFRGMNRHLQVKPRINDSYYCHHSP